MLHRATWQRYTSRRILFVPCRICGWLGKHTDYKERESLDCLRTLFWKRGKGNKSMYCVSTLNPQSPEIQTTKTKKRYRTFSENENPISSVAAQLMVLPCFFSCPCHPTFLLSSLTASFLSPLPNRSASYLTITDTVIRQNGKELHMHCVWAALMFSVYHCNLVVLN